jgi:hypothetical protein
MPRHHFDPAPPDRVVTCPSCRGKCRVRSTSTGKVMRCPRCHAVLRFDVDPPETGSIDTAQPQRQRAQYDDDEDDGTPYVAHAPDANRPYVEPEPDPIEDIEIRRRKPPPFVAPLWRGVYDFPWQPSGLRAWFMFGIGFTFVAFMAAAVHYALDLYQNSDWTKAGIFQTVLRLYVAAFGLFVVWTGTFAIPFFLESINSGAAGHYEVQSPDDSIGEKFFTFLGMVWVYALCAVPLGILAAPLQWFLGSMAIALSLVPSTILIFPVGVLCMLANNSKMNLWNFEVASKFLARPSVWLILYTMSTLLFGICFALGYLTIGLYEDFIFLAPVTGFVWSACFLIYGRLLGRVAWIVSGAQEEAWRDARRWKRVISR